MAFPFCLASVEPTSVGVGRGSLSDVLNGTILPIEASHVTCTNNLDWQYDHLGADGYAVVKIDDVIIRHADAATRHVLAD